jgi:hypothetical protein
MDASDEIMAWAHGRGYSVIDLNIFANPVSATASRDHMVSRLF